MISWSKNFVFALLGGLYLYLALSKISRRALQTNLLDYFSFLNLLVALLFVVVVSIDAAAAVVIVSAVGTFADAAAAAVAAVADVVVVAVAISPFGVSLLSFP